MKAKVILIGLVVAFVMSIGCFRNSVPKQSNDCIMCSAGAWKRINTEYTCNCKTGRWSDEG